MIQLLQSASDDQIALMGCAAAILVSGFMMYVSYFFGPIARQERQEAMQRLIEQRQKLLADLPREKAA